MTNPDSKREGGKKRKKGEEAERTERERERKREILVRGEVRLEHAAAYSKAVDGVGVVGEHRLADFTSDRPLELGYLMELCDSRVLAKLPTHEEDEYEVRGDL